MKTDLEKYEFTGTIVGGGLPGWLDDLVGFLLDVAGFLAIVAIGFLLTIIIGG